VDPYNEYTESDIISALKKAKVWDTLKVEEESLKDSQKKEIITEEDIIKKRLEMNIEAGGKNLSVGQKQ